MLRACGRLQRLAFLGDQVVSDLQGLLRATGRTRRGGQALCALVYYTTELSPRVQNTNTETERPRSANHIRAPDVVG